MHDALSIFVVSDGTGETADQMMKAALVQFVRDGLKVARYKNVRTKEQVERIFEKAREQRAIVVHTVVLDDVRNLITEISDAYSIACVDLLGPLLQVLGQHLRRDPNAKPGLFHQVNEYYFRRIEAIEFTVKHDDGRYTDNLDAADIILVGLSRTSKTPLSIYLSYKGWKVANVPIVKGIPLPEELLTTDQRKIIALTIESETLAHIRRERLSRMGEISASPYANKKYVLDEIEYCKQLYRRNRRWPVIDVTAKALEETATEVEKYLRLSIPEKFGHGVG